MLLLLLLYFLSLYKPRDSAKATGQSKYFVKLSKLLYFATDLIHKTFLWTILKTSPVSVKYFPRPFIYEVPLPNIKRQSNNKIITKF